MPSARLTLGPLLYNWPAETRRDFYARIADEAPVDTVHLGEVVCLKRAPFIDPILPELIERLQRAGKQVVLSTLALVNGERERAMLREVCATDGLLIEANDLSAVAQLAGRPHVVGPLVNVYNEGTLAWLAAKGAMRVCLPAELPATSIAALARGAPAELEVQVFGRLPLAISARCYHARAHGLRKDSCQYVCGQDPDGLAVETLDGTPFVAVNGTQTLSHACLNLLGELADLRATGIGCFRLWPQAANMAAVARLFRDVLDGGRDPADATAQLGELVPGMPFCDGYYHGREGLAWAAAATGE